MSQAPPDTTTNINASTLWSASFPVLRSVMYPTHSFLCEFYYIGWNFLPLQSHPDTALPPSYLYLLYLRHDFFLPLPRFPIPSYIFIKAICIGCRLWFALSVWAAWYGNHITMSLNGIICPLQTIMLTNLSINMRILYFSPNENIGHWPPIGFSVRHGWSYHHSSCPLTTLRLNKNGDRPWFVPWGERCCKIIRLLLG